MKRSDYRTLIDLGRKAGLRTSEIYGALSGRRPTVQDVEAGSDGNGFRAGYNAAGHQVYQPETRGRAL
jgi:hypothetical protein